MEIYLKIWKLYFLVEFLARAINMDAFVLFRLETNLFKIGWYLNDCDAVIGVRKIRFRGWWTKRWMNTGA